MAYTDGNASIVVDKPTRDLIKQVAHSRNQSICEYLKETAERDANSKNLSLGKEWSPRTGQQNLTESAALNIGYMAGVLYSVFEVEEIRKLATMPIEKIKAAFNNVFEDKADGRQEKLIA